MRYLIGAVLGVGMTLMVTHHAPDYEWQERLRDAQAQAERLVTKSGPVDPELLANDVLWLAQHAGRR